jgi:hypothetical protein
MIRVEALFTNSAPTNLLAMAVAGSVAGVYLFYRGFRLLQRRRLILNTPASKIRSASMGLVEVSGLATGPRVVTSPLRQVDCFYYRSMAWELRQRGKNREWVKIGDETFHVPFYIDDGSGTLMIDPSGADMDLHCDFSEQYNHSIFFSGTEMQGCVGQFLSRHGADFNKQIKVEEYCIKPKNFLFVLGTLAQNPGVNTHAAIPVPDLAMAQAATAVAGGAAGSRPLVDSAGVPLVGANYRQVVHIQPPSTAQPAAEIAPQQRVSAALTTSGITNPAAWAAAGLISQGKVHSQTYSPALSSGNLSLKENASPTNAVLDPHPSTVLMKGTHDSSFFISWRSQRELVSSLAWKSALMIWGGPALTLVCVYVLLANFKLL